MVYGRVFWASSSWPDTDSFRDIAMGAAGSGLLACGQFTLYLIGTIGVTIAGNIPLNDALAIVAPGSTDGATLWARYLTDWTFWNHVRTAAAVVAAGMLTFSLCL